MRAEDSLRLIITNSYWSTDRRRKKNKYRSFAPISKRLLSLSIIATGSFLTRYLAPQIDPFVVFSAAAASYIIIKS